jgi:hypothetical protein
MRAVSKKFAIAERVLDAACRSRTVRSFSAGVSLGHFRQLINVFYQSKTSAFIFRETNTSLLIVNEDEARCFCGPMWVERNETVMSQKVHEESGVEFGYEVNDVFSRSSARKNVDRLIADWVNEFHNDKFVAVESGDCFVGSDDVSKVFNVVALRIRGRERRSRDSLARMRSRSSTSALQILIIPLLFPSVSLGGFSRMSYERV